MKAVRGFARVSLVALVLLGGAVAATGCGDDGSTEAELREARQEGVQSERLRQLERQLREQRRQGGGGGGAAAAAPAGSGGATSGSTSCGDGLSVGPNTSCPFGENVRASYPGSGGAFQVFSPVTGETYTMRCTTGSPHVCTGGNDASVYFP
jgi:hypothetical protein